ncbi:MAG: hypothetical protein LBF78_11405 [Treponema sp.]|nr:hypothetical protein [Treponema sp.]
MPKSPSAGELQGRFFSPLYPDNTSCDPLFILDFMLPHALHCAYRVPFAYGIACIQHR